MLRLRPAIRAFATKKLNLNADLGEGFGPWRLTDDAALMDIVTSANVALHNKVFRTEATPKAPSKERVRALRSR